MTRHYLSRSAASGAKGPAVQGPHPKAALGLAQVPVRGAFPHGLRRRAQMTQACRAVKLYLQCYVDAGQSRGPADAGYPTLIDAGVVA